jgi:hypothetical protein
MSSTFFVHIGPYAEWLVKPRTTYHRAQDLEVDCALGWTDRLDEIVSKGKLTVNINGMSYPPSVLTAEGEYVRVCGYPVGSAGLRRMSWSENNTELAVMDLSEIDRAAEMEWFARTSALELSALSEYFNRPVHAIRWGYVGHRG